jgi:hypothetical protein
MELSFDGQALGWRGSSFDDKLSRDAGVPDWLLKPSRCCAIFSYQ